MIDSYLNFNTPKLAVPLKFEVNLSSENILVYFINFIIIEKNTISNRGWFIDPLERMGDKKWLILIAMAPALLSSILIFMDQHITAVIMNRKEHKLKVFSFLSKLNFFDIKMIIFFKQFYNSYKILNNYFLSDIEMKTNF